MKLYQSGNLAKSLAGHDKNKIYVIIREEEQEVFVADGQRRTVEKPKRKKKKHIQPIHSCESLGLEEKKSQTEQNEAIRKVIKAYEQLEVRNECERNNGKSGGE